MTDTESLPSSVWSGVPQMGTADVCHRLFRESLKEQIVSLITVVERTFSVEPGTLLEGIMPLDVACRYDPRLYTLHWKLAKELQDANAAGVVDVLGLFDELLPRPYADQGTKILQLDGSIADASVLEFLHGPEGARGPNGEVPSMLALPDNKFQIVAESVRSALALIASLDSGLGDELLSYAAQVKLFGGTVVRGMTSVRTFGCIYIRLPDGDPSPEETVLYFVDHLVHEVSHLHLHTLMNIDQLVTNPDNQRFAAPIRRDRRPLYGIYHATFVLSRIVRVLGRLRKARNSAMVSRAFADAVERYHKGYDTVAKHGTLTPIGRKLFESTRQVTELY